MNWSNIHVLHVTWLFLTLGIFPATGIEAQESSKDSSQGLSIYDVSVSATSFNPSRGDSVDLTYHLSRQATVTVKVFDPDQDLIQILVDKKKASKGAQRVSWDGKDLDGHLVPNEAYFFTVEAKTRSEAKEVVYDPVTFSGGEIFDITDGKFNREGGTLTYKLSQPSRVLIRIGIPGSALLRTLVDWKPRIAGEITEYWNGKDQDNLINVWNTKFTTLITYFTLPDNSVITFGTQKSDFRAYKSHLQNPRAKKVERAYVNARKISPHFQASRMTDRAFRVTLGFPEYHLALDHNLPPVKDKVLVRIDVDQSDKQVLQNKQFEIIFFVDNVYFAEEEKGYLPFNFPWELKQFSPGEHVLTVNVITFNDQIGTGSKKIKIIK